MGVGDQLGLRFYRWSCLFFFFFLITKNFQHTVGILVCAIMGSWLTHENLLSTWVLTTRSFLSTKDSSSMSCSLHVPSFLWMEMGSVPQIGHEDSWPVPLTQGQLTMLARTQKMKIQGPGYVYWSNPAWLNRKLHKWILTLITTWLNITLQCIHIKRETERIEKEHLTLGFKSKKV